jgi:hypothetical protein
MMYELGLSISLAAGFLVIRLSAGKKLPLILHLLLALGLGLGIDGASAFYTHILFNQFNRFLPIALVLLIIACLSFIKLPMEKLKKTKNKTPAVTSGIKLEVALGLGALLLIVLGIPLGISGHYFPLGGWDAWSCWSLKTKFIFLGHEHWKEILAPSFWRSNTQYPLLWPLINAWFMDLGGTFDQAVPMLNSIVIALLTAGILFFGLWELTGRIIASLLAAVIVIAIPFSITLYTSQYSDSLVGLYLLSTFACLLLAEKYGLPKLKLLSMVFLGMMSFAKDEGLVASGIAALLILWQHRNKKDELTNLLLAYVIAIIPTLIFKFTIAPKNEAFVNGLLSVDKHTDLNRIMVILVYPLFEFISAKWNGFWLLTAAGLILAGKKLWQSTLGLIGLSLVCYLGVVLAYYAVNTFFEINWWLSTTLSRILFALVPTLVFWISLGFRDA